MGIPQTPHNVQHVGNQRLGQPPALEVPADRHPVQPAAAGLVPSRDINVGGGGGNLFPGGIFHENHPLGEEVLAGSDIPIYLVDPDGIDEFEDLAYITGHPDIRRSSGYHVLNQKAMARRAAKEMGKRYEEVNLVVAHMGGGVSIGAHKHGAVVEATSGGSAGEGPFSSNRTGTLPLGKLVDLCFDGKHTKKDIMNMIMTCGGFLAHTGYTDLRIIEQKSEE